MISHQIHEPAIPHAAAVPAQDMGSNLNNATPNLKNLSEFVEMCNNTGLDEEAINALKMALIHDNGTTRSKDLAIFCLTKLLALARKSQTEINTEIMMTASSPFQNSVQDGDIYVGVPLERDTTATKSRRTSKGLLAFLLGLIMAFVSAISVQLFDVAHFFLFGSTWTLSALSLLLLVGPCVTVASLWFASKCHFFDDGADEDKNPLKENILVALCDLVVFGFIVGSLGSAGLVNRHPNLVYSLFGLTITYSLEEFDIRTLITVTLLWVFYTKLRVFHAAVNHANEAESGSKADPADHVAYYVRV
jgi:hypothetical protein